MVPFGAEFKMNHNCSKPPPSFAVTWADSYRVVVPLNDLQEEGGSVLHGFGEDLQQVSVVIEVH